VLAPLIGREKVPVSTKADDRRTAIASLMAILGIFLAVLQFISTALDLVTRTFAPLFQAFAGRHCERAPRGRDRCYRAFAAHGFAASSPLMRWLCWG